MRLHVFIAALTLIPKNTTGGTNDTGNNVFSPPPHPTLKRTAMTELTDQLYHQVQALAKRRAYRRFHIEQDVPGWEEAAHDAAIDCLIKRSKYQDEGNQFMTWAQHVIDNSLTDWIRAKEDSPDSLDNEEHPIDLPDARATLDEKMLLKEIKTLLDGEELKMFELRAEGLTFEQLGEALGCSKTEAFRKWKLVEMRIKEFGTI